MNLDCKKWLKGLETGRSTVDRHGESTLFFTYPGGKTIKDDEVVDLPDAEAAMQPADLDDEEVRREKAVEDTKQRHAAELATVEQALADLRAVKASTLVKPITDAIAVDYAAKVAAQQAAIEGVGK